jgi:hypothetical protein
MKLAERKEVVEKSGLCTFCLRHGADVECYAKGGLSKPRCERLGCDGEHVTGLHALLGEADAAVNLVAGDNGGVADIHEGEYNYLNEWAEENSWNGTLEVAEGIEEPEELMCSHTNLDAAPGVDMAERVEEAGEWEYESLWVGTISAVEVPGRADDITIASTGQGPSQEIDQGEVEEGTTGNESEQRDQEASQAEGAAGMSREAGHRSAHRLSDGRMRRPRPRPRMPSHSGLRARPEQIEDQQWEEVRHNVWLRQLLSDDSSDESDEEEQYGRFAESRRWMSELYGIPQYPTATMGRECSA